MIIFSLKLQVYCYEKHPDERKNKYQHEYIPHGQETLPRRRIKNQSAFEAESQSKPVGVSNKVTNTSNDPTGMTPGGINIISVP